MNSVIDDVVVGVLVLGAIAYAMTTLGPRHWRGRVLASVARLLERMPSMLRLRGVARRLGDRAAAKTGGACGGCGTCGSETAKSPPGAPGSMGAPGSREFRIPLSKIGKRT